MILILPSSSSQPPTPGGEGGPALGGEGGEHRHEAGEDGLQGRRAGEVRSVSDAEEAATQDGHQLGAGHGRQLKLKYNRFMFQDISWFLRKLMLRLEDRKVSQCGAMMGAN